MTWISSKYFNRPTETAAGRSGSPGVPLDDLDSLHCLARLREKGGRRQPRPRPTTQHRDHLQPPHPQGHQGTFRTAIDRRDNGGVVVNVFYKHSRIKQYLKDRRAMRIETVINMPRDLGCNARLPNVDGTADQGPCMQPPDPGC